MLATRMKLATASLLLLLAAPATATILPLPDEASWVGGWYDSSGPRVLAYDQNTGRMTYSAAKGGIYKGNEEWWFREDDNNGFFTWTATIDRHGNLVGTGAMSLTIDIGNGLELLATGDVVDFGFAEPPYCDLDPDGCLFVQPRVAIRTRFLDERLASFLGNYWVWAGSLELSMPGIDPLLSSFRCGGANNCNYSGDFIIGSQIPVSEPTTVGALAIGLLAIAIARRRKPKATEQRERMVESE